MTKTLYIATSEAKCGKSLIALGIMELILRKTAKVAFFRPIIGKKIKENKDQHIDLIYSHFDLEIDYRDSHAFYEEEVTNLITHGRYDEVLEGIIKKYKKLEKQFDFILIEGTDFTGESSAFEFNINADIAKNLGAPVLIVSNGNNKTAEETLRSVKMNIDSFEERECQVIGSIINRANPDHYSELKELVCTELEKNKLLCSIIPFDKGLESPSFTDIINCLDAKILSGGHKLQSKTYRFSVAAMQLQNYLDKLNENCLVITPGDRADIILGVLSAHNSHNYPNIAGIVLTGGLEPHESLTRLLEGLKSPVPILAVNDNTFETASKLEGIHTHLTSTEHKKIYLALQRFEEYVDTNSFEEKIANFESKGITPKMFEYNLIQQASSDLKHIVLPEGIDERILKAAEVILRNNMVKLTLLGDPELINEKINSLGLKFDNLEIINPIQSSYYDDFVSTLVDLRKDKGMTVDAARDLLADVSYFGTMMVYKHLADGMVSGAMHTTAHTIRPALQFIKTKPNCSVVSSVFFMCLEDRVVVYGDCAVNPRPNAKELAEIAISSAQTCEAFGIEPKVALLSYSSGSSGSGEEVERVREATKIAKMKRADIDIEGPIQYDAAVDPSVAKSKMPNSKVAGQASVLVFPDLNTGNNTYKAVQRETGALAIGPVLQGLNKPVNDLSRGCTVADIINTVVITAVQAQHEEK